MGRNHRDVNIASPTSWGKELDQKVRRILRRRSSQTPQERASQIFAVLGERTPDKFGGRTYLEILQISVEKNIRASWDIFFDPREILSETYLAIFEIVKNRLWKSNRGMAFLPFLIRRVVWRISREIERQSREMPFSLLQPEDSDSDAEHPVVRANAVSWEDL